MRARRRSWLRTCCGPDFRRHRTGRTSFPFSPIAATFDRASPFGSPSRRSTPRRRRWRSGAERCGGAIPVRRGVRPPHRLELPDRSSLERRPPGGADDGDPHGGQRRAPLARPTMPVLPVGTPPQSADRSLLSASQGEAAMVGDGGADSWDDAADQRLLSRRDRAGVRTRVRQPPRIPENRRGAT